MNPYDETLWTVRRHLQAGEYDLALPVARRLWDDFPDFRQFSYVMLAMAQLLAKDLDGALSTLEVADEEQLLLRIRRFQRPDFVDGLGDHPRFMRVMARAKERIASLNLQPGLLVAEATEPGAEGLVVGFHGATSTPEALIYAWRPATTLGWTVAAVRSTQPASASTQCWDNPEIVRQDLGAALPDLPDHRRVVLAGFSQGAATALDVALGGLLEGARRIIGVAPGLPGRPDVRPTNPPLNVNLIVGADDPYAASALQAAEAYRGAGHNVDVDVVSGLGHAYPDDFGARLRALLAAA
jgi:dienelactone hydrolase